MQHQDRQLDGTEQGQIATDDTRHGGEFDSASEAGNTMKMRFEGFSSANKCVRISELRIDSFLLKSQQGRSP